MNNQITLLSIMDLLSGQEDYIIPMYQRNYAWDQGEITQLIQDVIDFMPRGRNYYIGTLVVARKNTEPGYQIVDGQQRLTTLSLLASFLKNETDGDFAWYRRLNISFQSRKHSRMALEAAFEGRFKENRSEALQSDETNSAILNAYRLIAKILKLKEQKKEALGFADYLFKKVQIMRVELPDDTDLNHYFEIMNSRGEQLEKHEILKSYLMNVFNDDRLADTTEQEENKNCLHLVWEACANMEKYVQMGFTADQRAEIFGKDWSEFEVRNFDELREKLKKDKNASSDRGDALSLSDIIDQPESGTKAITPKEDEAPERFKTVINFPNFLLHVLRIQCKSEDIRLDDKQLLKVFEDRIRECGALEFVKQFVFNLLRCKYLFDHYVIKREFIKDTDRWSLKRMKQSDGGSSYYVNTFDADGGADAATRRIRMLLAAFHVSAPTAVYKYWLNAALYWLFNLRFIKVETIQAADYLRYLESVGRAFVFDRFLAGGKPADYFEIIYTNEGQCQAKREKDCDWTRLSFGRIEDNLVFNYLDYLLWVANENSSENKDRKVSDFEFTPRSSVEHYYPRNPLTGLDSLPFETLDSFGNLCLISHSKNSRLSNLSPAAKRDYYRDSTKPIDSVKQHRMMNYNRWDKESIAEHYEAMKAVLVGSLEFGAVAQVEAQ